MMQDAFLAALVDPPEAMELGRLLDRLGPRYRRKVRIAALRLVRAVDLIDGDRTPTQHEEHTEDGPADCPKCQMLRDYPLEAFVRAEEAVRRDDLV